MAQNIDYNYVTNKISADSNESVGLNRVDDSKQKPIAKLTRIQSFSSSHRLHNPSLDELTNKQTYGKCNNPNSHGHNYKVEVTVKGIVDPITGMVLDIAILKTIIDETIMQNLDHKNIDKDVKYFYENNTVSTAENIAVFIWKLVSDKLPNGVKLHSIKLHETDNNVVEYEGETTF